MTGFITTRKERRALKSENAKYPNILVRVSESEMLGVRKPPRLLEVWRSKCYLVQIFSERDGVERMSVNKTAIMGGRWVDGITWEELQSLKEQCGRGNKCAVEVYPPDIDKVDVANMRHLFVLPEPPDFMWTGRRSQSLESGRQTNLTDMDDQQ